MGETRVDRSTTLQPTIERLIDELVPLVTLDDVIERSSAVLAAIPGVEAVSMSVRDGDHFSTYRMSPTDGPVRVLFGSSGDPIVHRILNYDAHTIDVDNPEPSPPGFVESDWLSPYADSARRGVREVRFTPMTSAGEKLGGLWFNSLSHGVFDDPDVQAQIDVVAAIVSMALTKVKTIHRLDHQLEDIATTRLELESSNRQLQEFAQMASSGLSEPLRKIVTFGHRLETSAFDDLTERELDYLARIGSASARMQRLIDDLLTFSSVHTPDASMTTVDLDVVLDGVLADLEVAIAESGAVIEREPLPSVFGVETQLRQLLQNLIGNAIKFRAADASPHISIAALAGDPVRLQVKDDGIGFDPRFLDRIFKPFQRLHAKTDFEGSGIGLSVCRRIVERHGGELTASSCPGEGALFEATLVAGEPT